MEEVQNDRHEFYDDDIIDDLNDNDLLNNENGGLKNNSIVDENEEEENQWEAYLSEPEKVGDNVVNSYLTYTVTVKSAKKHPKFDKTEYTFSRRYSDFEWLRNKLIEAFKSRIIPPLPEKAIVKKYDKDFMNNRRKELERFLIRVLNREEFLESQDLQNFIQLDDSQFADIRAYKEKSKSFFSSISEKFTSVQASIGKTEEVDEWFDQQKGYLLTLETQFQVLFNKSHVISNKGKDIARSWSDIGQTSSVLTSAESIHDKVLSKWFAKFSEITNQLSSYEREMADKQVDYFEDVLKDYLRLMESIKETFNNRNIELYQYQSSSRARSAKEEKLHKNPDDPKLKQELIEATEKEKEAKSIFENTSVIVKEEILKFYKTKNKEITRAIHNLVQSRMDYHLKCADLWKEMLSITQEDMNN